MSSPVSPDGVGPGRVGAAESRAASRGWWDAEAASYLAEHGDFLGAADFLWCPEGLRESQAGLLGDLAGARVLEVGCGAAQCSRWLRERGVQAYALDLSAGMLRAAADLDRRTGVVAPVVQATAEQIPFRSGSFDVAFTAMGAVQFSADSAAIMREVARVLRPGGRWVMSTTHPLRWAFPDDPGEAGLTASIPYFDRSPYVETAPDGTLSYVEHHRTLGDRIAEITAAGMVLVALIEPEWPEEHRRVWGQWSPLRGAILPGTAIYVCIRTGPVDGSD